MLNIHMHGIFTGDDCSITQSSLLGLLHPALEHRLDFGIPASADFLRWPHQFTVELKGVAPLPVFDTKPLTAQVLLAMSVRSMNSPLVTDPEVPRLSVIVSWVALVENAVVVPAVSVSDNQIEPTITSDVEPTLMMWLLAVASVPTVKR